MSDSDEETPTDHNWSSEYNKRQRFYERLRDETEFALEDEIKRRNIKISGIVSRVKSYDSFCKKVERKSYNDPFQQMDDIAGVRIICLYNSDLDSLEKVISHLFEIKDTMDKTASLGSDRMGYQGRHYVVQLSSAHQGPRYDNLRKLRCEIQTRTILQDAWSQISHNLIYKTEWSIPEKISRPFYNVMSMLEIAQDIFDNFKLIRDSYIKEMSEKQPEQHVFLAQPINTETLSLYTRWKYPNLDTDEYVQELLIRDLDHERFKTLADIDEIVNAQRARVERYKKVNPAMFRSGTDCLTKSLGFGDKHFRETHPFGPTTRQEFSKHQLT